jgi:uroporphyrinogen-III synthase
LGAGGEKAARLLGRNWLAIGATTARHLREGLGGAAPVIEAPEPTAGAIADALRNASRTQ